MAQFSFGTLILFILASVAQAQWWGKLSASPPPPPLPDYETAEWMQVVGTGSASGNKWATGIFDGEYEPIKGVYLSGSFAYTFQPEDVAEEPRFLYKSDVWSGYWFLGTDLFSDVYYGYAYAPEASLPTEIAATEWQGYNVAGCTIKGMASSEVVTPTAATPTSPPPTMSASSSPTASPTSQSPTMTAATPTSQSPTMTVATPTSAPASSSSNYFPNNIEPTDADYVCSTGYSTVYANVGGCGSYCGCDSSTQTCSLCCKISGGYCYKESVPAAPATFNHGYKQKSCPLCTASLLGNDVCDPECNHPDCNFDNGDCCKADMSSSDTAHPMVCWDPESSFYEVEKNFRMDFNAPRCRHAVQNQGSCGACYAFATSSAAMLQACYAAVRKGTFEFEWQDLAPQHIDSCNVYGSVASNAGMCNGGYTGYTWGALADEEGFRPEHCYPYGYDGAAESHFGADVSAIDCATAYGARIESKCTGNDNYVLRMTERAGSSSVTNTDVTSIRLNPNKAAELRRRLLQDGPMPFSFDVMDSFYNLDTATNGPVGGGLYSAGSHGTKQGGHAVMLTGYGEYETSTGTQQFWVLENSWGYSSSHDQGNFYMDASVDWYTELGGYVSAHLNENSAGQYMEVVRTTTSSGSGAKRRRNALSAHEKNVRKRQVRRQAQETGQPSFNYLESEFNSILKGNGDIKAQDCFTEAITEAINFGIQYIADNFNIIVNVDGLYSCDTQVTAEKGYFLEVSFTDAQGEYKYYAFNSSLAVEKLFGMDAGDLMDQYSSDMFTLMGIEEASYLQNAKVRAGNQPVEDVDTTNGSVDHSIRVITIMSTLAFVVIAIAINFGL